MRADAADIFGPRACADDMRLPDRAYRQPQWNRNLAQMHPNQGITDINTGVRAQMFHNSA